MIELLEAESRQSRQSSALELARALREEVFSSEWQAALEAAPLRDSSFGGRFRPTRIRSLLQWCSCIPQQSNIPLLPASSPSTRCRRCRSIRFPSGDSENGTISAEDPAERPAVRDTLPIWLTRTSTWKKTPRRQDSAYRNRWMWISSRPWFLLLEEVGAVLVSVLIPLRWLVGLRGSSVPRLARISLARACQVVTPTTELGVAAPARESWPPGATHENGRASRPCYATH